MIPKLRFPEFADGWQRVGLADLSTEKGEYGMNAAAKPYDGMNKYLRITDIEDNTRKLLKNGITSPSGKLDDKYLLTEGDIVFARTGASTGKSYTYRKEDGRLYFAGFLIRFQIDKANPYFVYTQTLRHEYTKWVATVSARSGQPGINAEEYGRFGFYAPSKEEQGKIAKFLTLVDERIALMEKKFELLKKYKKGVMQKIFTQQIRFKDENGDLYPDWEEKKLSDIVTFTKGASISKGDIFKDGKHEAIRYGELYTRYNEVIDEVESRTDLPSKSLVFSKANDVIIPASGETHIDIATASCVLRDGIALSGDINILRPNCDGVFLAYYLNSQRSKVARLAQGVSVIHLYSSNLKSLALSLPVRVEQQQKIASFLIVVDDKIKLENKKLQKTKKFKKSLLQRMFV